MPRAVREAAVVVTSIRRYRRQLAALILALFPLAANAAVLPDDRLDILYHLYDGGGAEIDGPSILVRKNIANKVNVRANYYTDMVSSASIDVLATASPYTEERNEYRLGADYLYNKTIMSLNYSSSSESDYEAQTAGFSISQDFFGDLSTLSLSYAVGSDQVSQNGNDSFEEQDIDRQQFAVSLSQVITKNLVLNLTVESIVDEGFLNNPYRSVRHLDTTTADPNDYSYQAEQYPNTRNSDAVALKGIYYLPYQAALRGEYRHYSDSWGIEADNAELAYIHPLLDGKLTLELKYRHYSQTAAEFYSDLFPFQDAQNFLARDKELSTFTTDSIGLGVSYRLPFNFWGMADKTTINLFWDHMQFEYDDFRNVTAGGVPGQEPLYSFDADVVRLFLSVWY